MHAEDQPELLRIERPIWKPGEAKPDALKSKDAFLIDRPQYVISYDNKKTANWCVWQLSRKTSAGSRGSFEEDADLPKEP